MTFIEALSQIPIMLYACVVLLPVAMTAYSIVSKQRRAVPLRNVDPALMLQARAVNVKSAISVNIMLGVVLGIGIATLIFLGIIFNDWYNSTGLFAAPRPYNTLPPAITDSLPPQPPSYAKSTP